MPHKEHWITNASRLMDPGRMGRCKVSPRSGEGRGELPKHAFEQRAGELQHVRLDIPDASNINKTFICCFLC